MGGMRLALSRRHIVQLDSWKHGLKCKFESFVLATFLMQCFMSLFPLQIDIFTEEIIRSGSAASLSQLLNRIDPVLRSAANLGKYVLIFEVWLLSFFSLEEDVFSGFTFVGHVPSV